jgi:hypothetical protein
MQRDVSSGQSVYRCVCGTAMPGAAAGARIGGESFGTSDTAALYGRLISCAPYDPTNQLVGRLCAFCGLDYAAQLRVGDEVTLFRCKCGH